MNFKVNQRVVCTATGGWTANIKHSKSKAFIVWLFKIKNAYPTYGPKKDEVVTISFIADDGYLGLKEYSGYGNYDPVHFQPLNNLFADKLIEKIETEINEEILTLNK